LGPFDASNLVIPVTLLIGDIINEIRSPGMDFVMSEIRHRVSNAAVNPAEKEQILNQLCGLNNSHISLLENLTFLKSLAEIYHFKSVNRVCAIQITKHINLAVEDFNKQVKNC
jgi:hypothetical protein